MRRRDGLMAAMLAVVRGGRTATQRSDNKPVLKGAAAFGDWRADKPGVRRLIKPEDLPTPMLTKSASNSAGLAECRQAPSRTAAGLLGRAGRVGHRQPARRARRAEWRSVRRRQRSQPGPRLSARRGQRQARRGRASSPSDLNQPYGIAFYPPGNDPQWVYVANSDSIVRFAYKNGDLKAARRAGDDRRQHPRQPSLDPRHRLLAGRQDALSARSARARMSRDGHGQGAAWRPRRLGEVAAAGCRLGPEERPRRCAGLRSRRQERPHLRHRPAQLLGHDASSRRPARCGASSTSATSSATMCRSNTRPSSRKAPSTAGPGTTSATTRTRATRASAPTSPARSTVPDVLMQAHSAPLNIAFYDGDGLSRPNTRAMPSWPCTARGTAATGPATRWSRLLFKDGKPTGEYEDFITGFVVSDEQVWGRPVGVAVAKDGALIVTEDGNGTIWRVTYRTSGSVRPVNHRPLQAATARARA